MMNKTIRRFVRALLCLTLAAALLPFHARAQEAENRFILVVEASGKLLIAPEYISYTPGQSIGEALAASGHEFYGLEEGVVKAIDGVTGNYTRSDQNGGYDLATPAAQVTHYRFSEDASGAPGEELLLLMTAMADYSLKSDDVRAAAKPAFDTALAEFVGCLPDMARTLAFELEQAMSSYEDSLTAQPCTVTFLDSSLVYSRENYPGVSITAVNGFGRVWESEGNGRLSLPPGDYRFTLEQDGLRVQGDIQVSGDVSVIARLPSTPWLLTDSFALSTTYGADTNQDNRFTDGVLPMSGWNGRRVSVSVSDRFLGDIYTFAQYDSSLLSQAPELTAVYTMATSGVSMEKRLTFGSKTSGAYDILTKGAQGNTVIYRLSSDGADGYTYSQDYTVELHRVPTLLSLSLTDQNGTDLAPSAAFSPSVTDYTYKVLDTVTQITVAAQPSDPGYQVLVNGTDASSPVSLDISGDTELSVTVSSGDYSTTYLLSILPGEGRTMSFLSDRAVTVQVTNANGVVMPYTTHRESTTKNRYLYTLVPGETYNYIATLNGCYHITDSFTMEESANSLIQVDFSTMTDWLDSLAFGTGGISGANKGNLPMDEPFSRDIHSYQLTLPDTEHLAYIWVDTGLTDVTVEAMYTQVFSAELYHGKPLSLELVPGAVTGQQLKRFLMDENATENTLTVRLSREENGITYYQDYTVEFLRSLTLSSMSAASDGLTVPLMKPDGEPGFESGVTEYTATVSLAARTIGFSLSAYTANLSFGQEQLGYRIRVDGQDLGTGGTASVSLSGTMDTQTVTVTVENGNAPQGTATYLVHIQKSPPVSASFTLAPGSALLNIHENLSGQRLWPDSGGCYQLCEGYSYTYTLTAAGYVGIQGQLDITRDDSHALVIRDGEQTYSVTQDGEGGAAAITWELAAAPANPAIDPSIPSSWPNFRGNDSNNAVTSAPIPTSAGEGTLLWASKMGSGTDADAVGSPILVNGSLITYAGQTLYRVDCVTGEILATGAMDHKSSFSITPPTYADGMIFVALSGGTVQAFNAQTLESLWIFTDFLGGQPNCPLTVKDGYLYTGFWNSETGNANFVCLSITDEDPSTGYEQKYSSWYHTATGGYYWAGACARDGFVLVGTDDGTNASNSATSQLLLLDAHSGALLDSWDSLNGDIRSTVAYDADTQRFCFTTKGGSFCSFRVSGGKLTEKRTAQLYNGTAGIPMSTCSPVVYQGRAYVGVSGTSQFGAYSGHNISVIDLDTHTVIYSVPTQGYPQTSGLLSNYYQEESGYVYIYYFDNYTPGKLRVLRDRPGQTAPDYLTQEGSYTTAYAIFTPTGDQAEYAICSPIADEYGTVYFKNDSGYLMAFGSAVDRLEVTQPPEKLCYAEGETFDPTGMIVTAWLSNGLSRDVTALVTWPSEPLTPGDSLFTLSYPHVLYGNQENGTAMDSGIVATTPTVTLSISVQSALGDVNADGAITEADAQLILDYEAKLVTEAPAPERADVSGDGITDSNDAVLILQYIRKEITLFPAAAGEAAPQP